MKVRIFAVFCIIAAALIQLPDVQSKTTPPTFYDAWAELSDRFNEKYYLVLRSHLVDRKMGDTARCVSILGITKVFATSSITAQLSMKANRARDPTTNKVLKMEAYTPTGVGIKYMIKTTDQNTGDLLYNQKLTFTDKISCRVLVYTLEGQDYCQLWVRQSAVRGSIPRGCEADYDKYCPTRHQIFSEECLG
uniref:Putative conserved secreted protein n=1 Tax=Ixodes ricinus TaxID=34613 RepID=V5H3D8_IXORI